jgi:hypothetical protein
MVLKTNIEAGFCKNLMDASKLGDFIDKKIQAPKYFCSGGLINSLRQISKPPQNALPRVTDQPFYAGYGSVPEYAADKSRSSALCNQNWSVVFHGASCRK